MLSISFKFHTNAHPLADSVTQIPRDPPADALLLWHAGVNWFECDMADVIAAKRTQLEGAGAQVEVPAAGNKRHPLQVAQWHPFVCDLSQR